MKNFLLILVSTILFAYTDGFLFNLGGSTPSPSPCVRTNHSFECADGGLTLWPGDVPRLVKTLNLDKNNLSALGVDMEYPELQWLEVAYNAIRDVEDYAFEGCPSLQMLDLSNNQIKQIRAHQFKGMKGLTQLFLNGNEISYLESDAFYPHLGFTLKVLDLSDNKLTAINPMALTDLDSLQSLLLRDNQIRTLEKIHFLGLRNLQHLDLNQNYLTEIPAKFLQDCEKLQVLDMSLNNIYAVHRDAFIGLKQLDTLTLRNNRIPFLYSSFITLPLLANLHLDQNPLKTLENPIFPPSLKKLTLTQMPNLTSVRNNSLAGLDNLIYLNIDECPHLHTIDVGTFGGNNTNLLRVDFSANNLEYLEEGLLNWDKLEQLDLSGNPWRCDCHLKWIKNIKLETHPIRCTTPYNNHNKLVQDLTPSDFTCLRYISYRKGAAVVLILLMTFVFLAGGIFVLLRFKSRLVPCCKRELANNKFVYSTLKSEDTHSEADVRTQNGNAPSPVAV